MVTYDTLEKIRRRAAERTEHFAAGSAGDPQVRRLLAESHADVETLLGVVRLDDPHGCPFCGAQSSVVHYLEDVFGAYAYCQTCEAQGPSMPSEHEARRAWTKRG